MTQAQFFDALLTPEAAPPPGLVDPLGRVAPRRFDVYRNNVAISLVRALEDGFPVVRRLVGEAFFAAMALVHLRAHPPKGPLLVTYGAEFPGFLERFPPVAHLGYLPDVARLEVVLRESYHAADALPVGSDDLAALSASQILTSRMRLAPSLRLLRSDWPVCTIWRAQTEGGPAPVMQAEDVAVLRPAFDPRPHCLPTGALNVIAGLGDGLSLENALGLAPGVDAGALLTLLLQERGIVEILA
ncbi:MAG: DNA-binding domain-containing protein [Pseudotabrizicola sp.]|uniref:HvfC/BufC N-terminal domain-containing protein n=1 Tax=Pseudotabrizicola sp. TaxID=2939647 RepID=UPI0027180F90|nr:DNA-binding domain-containing protein [Pseudotabrizicola sp.]MDO8881618.1 DNA-binding domain-containing protein [Pseudotabrizicola sp.]MDP2080838.1 DNA-binding domain-containing protein [Pseudotabrizicola sp.]MDZ7572760.1 DNA-binding domain-containing protein [Pseudotabrizicola sp.]